MDYSLPVRRAVLKALKVDAGVTALIPANSLFPSVVPPTRAFPFGRYGAPQTTPFRLSGLSASAHRFTYHAFMNSAPERTAEDRAYDVANAIQAALDGRCLPIEGGMHATVTWLGSNCLIDGDETSNWHAVVNFSADVAG